MTQSEAMPGRTGHLLNLLCVILIFDITNNKGSIANAKSLFI